MAAIPLRLGPLAAPGYRVRRSGLRWLCDDGQMRRAGEPVAYCNVGLAGDGADPDTLPFADERRDLQAVLLAPASGRVTRSQTSSRGGYLDMMDDFQTWQADDMVGAVETAPGEAPAGAALDVGLVMTAGRRATELAVNRSGLATGWHDRARAWKIEGDGAVGGLLSLGVCEMLGVIRGERFAALEILGSVAGPAQVVFVADEAVTPTARHWTEQMQRSEADRDAIAADLARGLAKGPVTPDGADLMYAGAVLKSLQRSAATDRYDLLCRDGLRRSGPPDAILLSVLAEVPWILRHRRLGYALHCPEYRVADAGPAMTPWMKAHFEPVRRGLDDIRQDYRRFIDLVRRTAPETRFLICNGMASSGYEDIQSYAGFDAPLGDQIDSVRRADLNLMLHDLARERDIAIVDADAIAVELGGQRSMPDGMHQSGPMQAELRAEILRILADRKTPGFTPA